MKFKQKIFHSLTLTLVFLLAACSTGAQEEQHTAMNHEENGHMNHSSSGEVPKGLKEAETPAFKVGSKAIMNTDHMEGMNGAEATIVGAFDTTVYAISYTPTTGGEQVENHKWIVHEEIKGAKEEPYEPGDKVAVEADHMEGMEGAEATIDSAEQTTVYMVDYSASTDGELVKNHKWVTESELSAR
ncbi:YdhK family protein [Planococcus shenhongbingii]|uniref:YdhK family protein n=1 Tax=Planococcus shenhongbingii TaxID=3058398 RepID=A0ABT8NGX9_9BACL|nr:YdhK family protein [Planococcus sp. N017]MDN7247156.1 YdhK family protein [Planococcus sp. N017]